MDLDRAGGGRELRRKRPSGGKRAGSDGLLKPGVSMEQARADLSSVARGLAQQYSDSNKWYTTASVSPQLEFRWGRRGLRWRFCLVRWDCCC